VAADAGWVSERGARCEVAPLYWQGEVGVGAPCRGCTACLLAPWHDSEYQKCLVQNVVLAPFAPTGPKV